MIKSRRERYDFQVQVRDQEREEPPSVARLFRGIFWMTLNDFVNVIFIPSFPRNRRNWSLNIADDIEHVRSLSEARKFTAALSDYTVTPDDNRAGQQELIPIPPPPKISAPGFRDDMATESRTGVIFYVTQKEFTRFSQELALMEEQTSSVYDYLPFGEVKDFECMQFILNDMVASPHFAEKDLKIVNGPWYDGFLSPFGVKFNKIERLVPSEHTEKEVERRAQEEFALQSV